MRVLLTGANGHLGANTARALLKRGHQLVAFVRAGADLRGLEGLDVELAVGDITNKQAVLSAATSCEAIIHSAAVFQWWCNDPQTIMRPAIQGCKNVFEAAAYHHIKRVVYTSSVVAIGCSDDSHHLLSSDDWNSQPHTPYAKAKTQSERIAWQLAKQYATELIVLCPGSILGPYDYRITPSMRLLRDFAAGRAVAIDSGLTIIDVRDAAAIHALAIEQGQAGKRYALVAENISFGDFANLISQKTARRIVHFNSSRWLAKSLALLMELSARITAKDAMFTRALIDEYWQRYQHVFAADSFTEFDYQPRALHQTLDDSLQWLLQIRALKPFQLRD
jgi:dihydroflavonol-4-reductase